MSDENKKIVDWEKIELDYRAGLKTLRQIADEHGISHVAINKRAKSQKWERDLAAKIKAKADALVTKTLVTKEVTKNRLVTEQAIVDANAQAIANIKLAHRTDIQRSRKLAMNLLGELEQTTDNLGLFQQLGEMLRSNDKNGIDKLNDLYRKVIDMPNRTKTMKDLADTLRILVGLERESYGIETAVKNEHSGPNGNPIAIIQRVIVDPK